MQTVDHRDGPVTKEAPDGFLQQPAKHEGSKKPRAKKNTR